MIIHRWTRRRAIAALGGLWLALAPLAAPGLAADADLRAVLAPSGQFRAALYPGTPTSILGDPAADPRGVGYEIGAALARRIGVPYAPVVFPRNAEVLEAVKTGAADAAFTNASPARAREMDFGPPYLEIELGYLVRGGAPVATLAGIDRPGLRVGVTAGSSSDGVLSRELKSAELVRAKDFAEAVALLTEGRLDAFATNKATLYEMAEKLPGAQVLDGQWGVERHAIAIPKGREAALPTIRAFTAEIIAQGLVQAAITRAGLRGARVPAAP
jgi:polar amino acid transport system substrate-binding protein